jgi:hypothetical protein
MKVKPDDIEIGFWYEITIKPIKYTFSHDGDKITGYRFKLEDLNRVILP